MSLPDKPSKRSGQGQFSRPDRALAQLSEPPFGDPGPDGWPHFHEQLSRCGLQPLRPTGLDILQVNVGYVCNQTCAHCHVDAGPDRRERMTPEIFGEVQRVLQEARPHTLDLTGGAPEMNPEFVPFIESVRAAHGPDVLDIIVRSNLTILESNDRFRALVPWFAEHKIHVVSSLPSTHARATDRQRGEGVFGASIRALKALNAVGYGEAGSGLVLDLVHNPTGAFLPGDNAALESRFKQELAQQHDVVFNNLLTITNLPISRYLDFLVASGNYEDYMEALIEAFNPAAAAGVMCRNTLSVRWDGVLYDCDFNQMLDLPIRHNTRHIRDWAAEVNDRDIAVHNHCYGCTAGAGSSCSGTIV